MAEVELTGKYADGRVAIVDDEDYERVAKFTWWCTPYGYASTHMPDGFGERKTTFMHRYILGFKGSLPHLDHRNRDRLDNRKANLRTAEGGLNQQNRGSVSGYRGVSWDAPKERWRARVMLNGTRHHLGHYHAAEAAAEAVELFRAEHMPWVTPFWPPRGKLQRIPASEWPPIKESDA